MENASKALIIAGAILLSILIIALGMGVFNQAKEAMSGSGLDAEQIAAYNAKFEEYVGNKRKGSDARALCEAIKNHNLAADGSESYKIKVSLDAKTNTEDVASTDVTTNINTMKANIKVGKTYTITVVTYDTSGGFISEMKIVEN